MILRLCSYNVHKCVGMDRRRRPDRTLSVLGALRADILVLQEVDRRLGVRPAILPREETEEVTGLVAVPVAMSSASFGWHGQTILARPDLRLADLRRIDLPGLEPRGAILAEFEGPDGPFRIGSMHLGLLRRSRRMQLATIIAAISARRRIPTVLAGDYNEWSPRGGTEELGAGFHVHAPGPSFPATRPVARLDRIALAYGAHLHSAGIHSFGMSRVASDHLPLWADIRFSEPAG